MSDQKLDAGFLRLQAWVDRVAAESRDGETIPVSGHDLVFLVNAARIGAFGIFVRTSNKKPIVDQAAQTMDDCIECLMDGICDSRAKADRVTKAQEFAALVNTVIGDRFMDLLFNSEEKSGSADEVG